MPPRRRSRLSWGAAEVLDGSAEALGQLTFLGDRELPAGGIQLLTGGLEGMGEQLAAELELSPGEVGARQEHAAGEALEQHGPSVVLQPKPVVAQLHAVLAGNGVLIELPLRVAGTAGGAR